LEGLGLEGEVLVGAQVVDPELAGGTYQRSCPLEAQLLSSWIQPTALFGSWASWPVEMLHHSLRLLVMASAPDCG
jgi:hypothetical protein